MSTFGSNLGYVDELYARYLEDPSSVGEVWREFFADYHPGGRVDQEPPRAKPAVDSPAPSRPTAEPERRHPEELEPLRGVAGRIVENMTTSLEVPTATSVRTVPVKLLEENRRIINQHQANVAGPKISFTHVIAWAIVRALVRRPAMNAGFEDVDGVPNVRRRERINLGLAIDLQRGERRVLLVPNLKDAGRLTFSEFVAAYNGLVLRARQNKLEVDEFQDTTVTLTNPGMLGTAMSVPRLMAGQGAIFGIGSIGHGADFSGMSPDVVAELGVSRTMVITSTYDHRVIQGAESGAFLADLEKLLTGEDDFYHDIFADLQVPNEPLEWSADRSTLAFGSPDPAEIVRKQASVLQLIRSYRARGHLYADLDPLEYAPQRHEELELSHYGLTLWDLDRRFISGGLAGVSGMLPLREILDTLRETYCRHIGVEFMHIPEPEPRVWLQSRMERSRLADSLDTEEQKRILEQLNAADAFERFLHTTYVGHKRFSLEGAESLVPALDALLESAEQAGIRDAVIGMAHRGRLNVLANTIGMSYDRIFRKFEGVVDPELSHGSGDVVYHLGFENVHRARSGNEIRLTLASNPSHLEAVDPVVEGIARARQDRQNDDERERVLPILIHGDAAFAGQGVVAETLNLSQLRGYRTGGTVHIVVNNQIGFTTGPADARSSMYSTDVAKMVRAPIFHVNGDYPEDVVRVVRLALEFRQTYRRDVVIDMVCYRRWGHNESDDPSYTNPLLYAKIKKHRGVRKLYTEQLLRRGDLDLEEAERALDDFNERLRQVHDEVREALSEVRSEVECCEDPELTVAPSRPAAQTAVPRETLETVLDGLDRRPDGFEPYPKLVRQLDQRRKRFDEGRIDWALAEALAFGSLVLEGTPVRLSGEDSGRGTFSQRHAVLYDHRTGEPYVPLAHLSEDQARFAVFDSLLSEFAVLGFEYGYSVAYPGALVMWEAQFGDFVNGAQVIIDQFIASALEKWDQTSGVVLLLPHGIEGQGPEHSSARLERFLQLCAQQNLRVAYPSTPAQYFHVLRRQVLDREVKPLVVMTPKSMLRNPAVVSVPEDLSTGRFEEVLPDPDVRGADGVSRVVLCSGKIYHDLVARRGESAADGVAIVRVEELYPWPAERVASLLAQFRSATDVVWVQEEPRNMGAWSFAHERLVRCLAPGQDLRYWGRPASASPSGGSYKRFAAEQEEIVRRAVEGRPEKAG
jgi:2-oxoglutarate dehydrogenase E1 component